jgi:predicted phosphohydrolase
MKIAWLTDIHINFLSLNMRKRFYEEIRDCGADVILISGDIAKAPSLELYLNKLREVIGKDQKVYFVAGNHDYYEGSVKAMQETFERLSYGNIRYLPHEGGVYLNETTALVGVDGWADGRYGDYASSDVVLNDSRYIMELFDAHAEFPYVHTQEGKIKLLTKMQELADKDARALADAIEGCIATDRNRILVVTHIPPFPECSKYQGKMSGLDYLPFYTCKATGDVIMEYAERFPHIKFDVFCGHSHHKALYEPLPNLTVKCGEAQYYMPVIQEIFEI